MDIKMEKKGVCAICDKKATKTIDGLRYCPACGDNVLIKTIGKCAKAVELARVGLSIMPRLAGIKAGHAKA